MCTLKARLSCSASKLPCGNTQTAGACGLNTRSLLTSISFTRGALRVGLSIALTLASTASADDYGDAPISYGDAGHTTVTDSLLESLRVADAGASWQPVSFKGNFIDPTVVCTYNLGAAANAPAVVRVRNILSGSFELKLQFPEEPFATPSAEAITPNDVYCIAAEQGSWALPGGLVFTAGEVLSDTINGPDQADLWDATVTENITSDLGRPFVSPVVLGQVVTANDDAYSIFWSNDCSNELNPPDAAGICVGKHVGGAPNGTTRNPEELGYIVLESGTGSSGGYFFEAALGEDIVQGVDNSPPYSYTTSILADAAVATQSAMDGSDGAWAVFFGANPLAGNALNLAVDEDTVSDSERAHITEQVSYLALSDGDTTAAESDVTIIVATPYIGVNPGDDELGSQYSPDARLDDDTDTSVSGVGNDEDGVTIKVTNTGQVDLTASVLVTNPTSSSAVVCAWLDISAGVIDDAFDSSEGRCATLAPGVKERVDLVWSDLPDLDFTTYARFRIAATTTGLNTNTPTSTVAGGEVEDYRVEVVIPPPLGRDYGDAPASYGEAGHDQTALLETITVTNFAASDGAADRVKLKGVYIDPVVACTYRLDNTGVAPNLVRVSNVTGTGFDIKVQTPQTAVGVDSDVYCLVAESGVHTLPNGTVFEAGTTLSTATNSAGDWSTSKQQRVELGHSFTAPAVLGQVMSENDDRFSSFWSSNCVDRTNPPTANALCVGKNVLEDPVSTRLDETLGYIVVETGAGTVDGVSFEAALGVESIAGVGNPPGSEPPRSYTLAGDYAHGVATVAGIEGNNGGWAVLFGADPLPTNAIDLAIDEDTIADSERVHTEERVAYWVFTDGDALLTDEPWLGVLRADLEPNQPDSDGTADDTSDTTVRAVGNDEDGVIFTTPAGGGRAVNGTVVVNNPADDPATVCAWFDRPNAGTLGIFDTSDLADLVDGAASVSGCTTVPERSAGQSITFRWEALPAQSFNTFARFRVSTDSAAASPIGIATDGEVEDYPLSIDFSATAVTLGSVSAVATNVSTLLADNDTGLDAAQLLALVSGWDADLAANLAGARRAEIAATLRGLLDPDGDGKIVLLRWTTLEERGTIGFYVQRRSVDGDWESVNKRMLPGLITAPLGGQYQLFDPAAPTEETLYYQLIEQEGGGAQRLYGPFNVNVGE